MTSKQLVNMVRATTGAAIRTRINSSVCAACGKQATHLVYIDPATAAPAGSLTTVRLVMQEMTKQTPRCDTCPR